MTPRPLTLSRAQILGFRRHVSSLTERMALSTQSLVLAARAGLQDSMPRAALLSIHARVAGAGPASWGHPALVQLWGPRFAAYVVAVKDVAVFTLGRLPRNARARARAQETAMRLHAFLKGRHMPYAEAGRGMGVQHNSLRYAAPTGTVLMRWDAQGSPAIWSAPAPAQDPQHARLELLRRYLHIFGPGTVASFACWAGLPRAEAHTDLKSLEGELTPVRTPLGAAWILAMDEDALRRPSRPEAPARLLPSGDAYYLLWGEERKLLVPERREREALWTSRVWPGALLVEGEIAGTWRRSGAEVSISPRRRFSRAEREATEDEARSLPLPDLAGPISIAWG